MAMILNTQYPDGDITAATLLGEQVLGEDVIQSDLKKLTALMASRNGRSITPGDLIGNGRGGDLETLKAADRKLSKLLGSRTAKRSRTVKQ